MSATAETSAPTLQDILDAIQATDKPLNERFDGLDRRLESFGNKLVSKFDGLDRRLESFGNKLDRRLESLGNKLVSKFDGLDRRLESLGREIDILVTLYQSSFDKD